MIVLYCQMLRNSRKLEVILLLLQQQICREHSSSYSILEFISLTHRDPLNNFDQFGLLVKGESEHVISIEIAKEAALAWDFLRQVLLEEDDVLHVFSVDEH